MKIKLTNIHKDNDDKYVVTDTVEKLDLLGAHLAKINNANRDKRRVGLNNIVKLTIDNFKLELKRDETEKRQ